MWRSYVPWRGERASVSSFTVIWLELVASLSPFGLSQGCIHCLPPTLATGVVWMRGGDDLCCASPQQEKEGTRGNRETYRSRYFGGKGRRIRRGGSGVDAGWGRLVLCVAPAGGERRTRDKGQYISI